MIFCGGQTLFSVPTTDTENLENANFQNFPEENPVSGLDKTKCQQGHQSEHEDADLVDAHQQVVT